MSSVSNTCPCFVHSPVRHFVFISINIASFPQVDLDLPSGQILGLFIRIIRKFVQLFNSLEEGVASASLSTPTNGVDLQPLEQSVDEELVCVCLYCGGVVCLC